MGQRFLDNVRAGKNDGWRYVAVLGVAVYYWVFWAYYAGAISAAVLLALPIPTVVADTISRNVPFAIMLGWLALALPWFHARSLRSLVNAESRINFGRVAQGFCLWAVLMVFNEAIAVWLEPQDYIWHFYPGQWLGLLVISLLLVPIQTSIEELLFRGYVMQAIRLFTRHSFLLILFSSILFTLPHLGNPEMLRGAFVWGALNYFLWGVIFAVITLKDNGLELALGVHAANNIVASVVTTTPDSVIQAPALLTYIGPLDPRHSFVSLLYGGVFFYSIFFGLMPARTRPSQSADSSLPR